MKHRNKTLSKSFYKKLYVILGIALIIFAAYNIFQGSSFEDLFEKKVSEAKEDAKPAEIKVISISTSDCEECYDISSDLNNLKNRNVKILEERSYEFDSKEAKLVINKYDMEKLPSFVVLGEIDKHNLGKLEKIDDALVFTEIKAPYVDANTSKVRGLVTLTLIDTDCEECYDIKTAAEQLKQAGLVIKEEKIFMFGTSQANNIINKYDIEYVPTLILSSDASVYPGITSTWNDIGIIADDGSFVLKTIIPPYVDVSTGETIGIVDVIYLEDQSCGECYDVMIHEPILSQRFALVLGEEKTIDASSAEGSDLIDKYDITKIPTIILSDDADIYDGLKQVWTQVGSVEDDGTYVFRAVDTINLPYKDLTTGEEVNPAAS